MTDLIAQVRTLELDHGPGGWPAVEMATLSALADEVERLRAALARANRGESICLKCGLRQDSHDAAAHAAAYPAF